MGKAWKSSRNQVSPKSPTLRMFIRRSIMRPCAGLNPVRSSARDRSGSVAKRIMARAKLEPCCKYSFKHDWLSWLIPVFCTKTPWERHPIAASLWFPSVLRWAAQAFPAFLYRLPLQSSHMSWGSGCPKPIHVDPHLNPYKRCTDQSHTPCNHVLPSDCKNTSHTGQISVGATATGGSSGKSSLAPAQSGIKG